MRHTARRLYPFADKNKVIHIDYVTDPALRRLATDRRINDKIRKALYRIDPQVELLIPYQVDDQERQLKRYIQYKLGLTVNLSTLRDEYNNYYIRMQSYGSPREVLERWGLAVAYDHVSTLNDLIEELEQYADNGTVYNLYSKNERLYRLFHYHAKKEGKTVPEFLEGLGYAYGED